MARILIVDDSLVDRQVAGKLLQRDTDWVVDVAENGRAALEKIELDLPDLVVTDLQMPEMNGLELVEAMREEYPLIPVILMTAAGSEKIAVEAIDKGAASYVPKTELSVDLVATVHRILAQSTRRRGRRRLLNYMNEVEYALDNDLELISSLVAEVRELTEERCLLEERDSLRLATAVDEALTNAYYHGNLEISSEVRERDAHEYHSLAMERRQEAPYADRQIHVRLQIQREQLSITIRDEGPGFDPESLPDPTAPGYLERPCGRGVLLMRAFMDVVSFNDAGNEVTLVKYTRQVNEPVVEFSE